MSQNGKPVLMLLAASSYREEEYLAARRALEQRGNRVLVASTVKKDAVGTNGNSIDPDLMIDDVRPEDYAGVVIIGGHGASQFWHDVKAHKIIRKLFDSGQIVAAIDRAPVALGVAGILKGKRVTGHMSVFEKLVNFGAHYTAKKVERDGNIVTGEGANASTAFAEALAQAFNGQ